MINFKTNSKKLTVKLYEIFLLATILCVASCKNETSSPDITPPTEVANFTGTAMDSKIALSWTNPTDGDFSGVEITCEPKAGSLENPMTLKKGVTSLIVYGLENGTEYTFTIKTFDTSGNFSTGAICKGKIKIPLEGITINYEGQSDIKGLEHAISDESITFTAPEGYESYKWRLDNTLLETNGETPNSITIERNSLSGGVHSLMVIANGMYSAACTITVKDGENFTDFSQVENAN